jgi:hypothetical protein
MPAAHSKKQSGVSFSGLVDIRALSIRQPWAELILRRRKPIEIRTWKSEYRGWLLIHASGNWEATSAREMGINKHAVTQSAFVGIAKVKEIRPFTRKDASLLKKKRGGDGWWGPGQFAWVLESVHRIEPIPFKGRLGLFRPPARVLHGVAKGLQKQLRKRQPPK